MKKILKTAIPCHYRRIKVNRKKRKEALEPSAKSYHQDDMYVRDFSSMYSDECSKSTYMK